MADSPAVGGWCGQQACARGCACVHRVAPDQVQLPGADVRWDAVVFAGAAGPLVR